MTERHDCEAFASHLYEVPPGGLDPKAWAELRRQAERCASCAAVLRMHELLDVPPQEELEKAVPDLHARGMWLRVREAIRETKSERTSVWTSERIRPVGLVPALVAAIVVLVLGIGLLAAERASLLERQSELAGRLADQERRLTILEGSGTSGLPRSVTLFGGPEWERALEREKTVTLGQVREWLTQVPTGTTLVGTSELEELGAWAPLREGNLRRDVAERIDASDGLQAGELLHALGALDLRDDTPISTTRLLNLYRATVRSARS